MKKLSLLLATAFVGLSASAQLYVTGETVTGAPAAWNPGNPLEVTLENGAYTFKAKGPFKISTTKGSNAEDWATFNSNVYMLDGAWNKSISTATASLKREGDGNISTPKSGSEITYVVSENLSSISATLPDGEIFDETAPDFYVIGPAFGGWNLAAANCKMTCNGNVYTYVAENGIDGEWKINNGTWDVSYGQGEDGMPVVGTVYNVASDGGNMTSAINEKVTITFTYVEGGQSTILLTGEGGDDPEPPTPPTPGDVYPSELLIIGDLSGWLDGNEKTMTNEGNGVYTITLDATTGKNFRFMNKEGADWNTTEQWGGAEYDMTNVDAVIGTNTLVKGKGNFTITEDGNYTITVNLADMTMILAKNGGDDPEPPTPGDDYSNWYVNVIGVFNDWKDNGVQPNADGIATHTGLKIGTGEFRIKCWNGTEDLNFSTGSTVSIGGWVKLTDTTGAGMTIANGTEDDVYTVEFNCETKEVKISLGTGIEAIEAEAGEAVYFNLQGQRVENPANGLFVRVLNGKATKVMVK